MTSTLGETFAGSKRLTGRVLLVEDDRALRDMAAEFLGMLGHELAVAAALDEAVELVRAQPFDVVLSDLLLERGTGLELLRTVREENIPVEVIIMTGHGDVETAVEAIREGAYDFVTKPLDLRRLEFDVLKALQKRRLEQDLERLRAPRLDRYGELVGASPAMRTVFSLLDRAAASTSSVLVVGPSGAGKEVVARAIHETSTRARGPFVTVDCASLNPELAESELFGVRKGAFTGAEKSREGLLMRAQGGTLFLDEISAAPERVQKSLLRVLQERRMKPLGAERDIELDLRLVTATSADLEEDIAAGSFRQDLYYRLATLIVRIPPLSERREDIPLLVGALLDKLHERHGREVSVSPRALEALMRHDWPGNVRELEHCLEQALIMARTSLIRPVDLPLDRVDGGERVSSLEEVERAHIRHVLTLCGGNKRRCAQLLDIPRATLYRKLERFGIDAPAKEPS